MATKLPKAPPPSTADNGRAEIPALLPRTRRSMSMATKLPNAPPLSTADNGRAEIPALLPHPPDEYGH
jgi:hypothetical protein